MSFSFTAVNFIQYALKAKGNHRLHSPFFFAFYNNVIKSGKNVEPSEVFALRKKLLYEYGRLQVGNSGAGSVISAAAHKSIADITRHTAKNDYWLGFFYRLAHFIKAENVLELGAGMGLTAASMGLVSTVKSVTTIEGSTPIATKAEENINELKVGNKVRVINGTFDDVLADLIKPETTFDLVFIDGNHTYEATMRYFKIFGQAKFPPRCIVFDDIYWSVGMLKAWVEIRQHPYARQTLDLFKVGLVFNNTTQAKEHKTLRIPLRALTS